MKDLTKGKPSTLILAFALPIFFANLLQLTYSLVDTRIVGTFLGEDALAAVGATSTLSNLIIGFLQGLSGGFAIITAQKFGAFWVCFLGMQLTTHSSSNSRTFQIRTNKIRR